MLARRLSILPEFFRRADMDMGSFGTIQKGKDMTRANAISLTDHFEAFISEKTSEGRFASPSAVVEAGLRLLEKEEAKLALLRKALADGETSGLALPFDFQEFYDEIDADAEAAG